MSEPALRFQGVSKAYGDFIAVNDLSFEVAKGSITGFLGPNGAGKTSSVRMMLGLSTPSQGQVSVLGSQGPKVLDRIGFLPEERGLYRKMNAVDMIVFLAGLKGIKASVARERARSMLKEQGLGDFMRTHIKDLSKGMQQKVQLIACLVHDPELVILDEPFSGLDPVNQQGLEAIIREIAARGATVLFSTHIMQHAERLCDKVVLIAKGQKIFEGTVAQARARAPHALDLRGNLDPAVLKALPHVKSVTEIPSMPGEGTAYRLEIESGQTANQALKTAFLNGLDIVRFEAREPSLHEAFIVLTGETHA